jgi:hypothetical protein
MNPLIADVARSRIDGQILLSARREHARRLMTTRERTVISARRRQARTRAASLRVRQALALATAPR